MNYEQMNVAMLEPLDVLVNTNHVRRMTIRCKPRFSQGDDRVVHITVERYDSPVRFYIEIEQDQDGELEKDFDAPILAYHTPQEAFYGAVQYIDEVATRAD